MCHLTEKNFIKYDVVAGVQYHFKNRRSPDDSVILQSALRTLLHNLGRQNFSKRVTPKVFEIT